MPSGHVNPKASLHSITQQPAAGSAGVETRSFSDSSRQASRSSPDHNGNGTAARSRRPSISAFAAAMTPSSPTSRMRAKFSNVHGHLPSVNVGGGDDNVAPAPPSGVLFPYTPMSSLPSSAVMQVGPQSAGGNRRPGLLSPGPSHFEKILADRAAASKHKHTNSVDSDNASLASFGCEGAVEFDRQYRNITNADLDPGVRERFLDGIFMKLTSRAGKSGSQSRTSPGSAKGRQGKVRALKPHFLDLTAIINPVPRDQRDTSVQTPSSTSSTSTSDSPVSWDADVPQGVSPTGSTPLLRSRRSAESLADGRRRRKQSWFGANVAGVPPTSADMRVTQSAQEYSSSSHVPTLPEWAKKSNMSRCDLPKSQLDEPLSPISPLARSAQSNSQSAYQPKDTSTIRGPRAHGKVSGSHSRARSIHDALISANVAPSLDANNVAMTRAASYDVTSGNSAPARGSQLKQEPMNHLHSLMHLDGPLQPGVVVPRSGLPSSRSSPKKDSRRGDENVSPNAGRHSPTKCRDQGAAPFAPISNVHMQRGASVNERQYSKIQSSPPKVTAVQRQGAVSRGSRGSLSSATSAEGSMPPTPVRNYAELPPLNDASTYVREGSLQKLYEYSIPDKRTEQHAQHRRGYSREHIAIQSSPVKRQSHARHGSDTTPRPVRSRVLRSGSVVREAPTPHVALASLESPTRQKTPVTTLQSTLKSSPTRDLGQPAAFADANALHQLGWTVTQVGHDQAPAPRLQVARPRAATVSSSAASGCHYGSEANGAMRQLSPKDAQISGQAEVPRRPPNEPLPALPKPEEHSRISYLSTTSTDSQSSNSTAGLSNHYTYGLGPTSMAKSTGAAASDSPASSDGSNASPQSRSRRQNASSRGAEWASQIGRTLFHKPSFSRTVVDGDVEEGHRQASSFTESRFLAPFEQRA